MAEFECRLKKYRQLKDLTQEQLAEKVGVRREMSLLAKYPQNKNRFLSLLLLMKTAKMLNMSFIITL